MLPSKNLPLPEKFYHGNTLQIARHLLGKGLVVGEGTKALVVELVEVEAYLGEEDPASHAFRGPTRRNWPMFESGGTCYIYLSYGVNYCMNVVTGRQGMGEAVLIRAVAPHSGVEIMQRNRGKQGPEVLNGPGKLTQALGLDLKYNGRRFNEVGFKLINLGISYPENSVSRSGRIGISRAQNFPFRFYLRDSPWVSKRK